MGHIRFGLWPGQGWQATAYPCGTRIQEHVLWAFLLCREWSSVVRPRISSCLPALARPKRKTDLPLGTRRTWLSIGLPPFAMGKRKMDISLGERQTGSINGWLAFARPQPKNGHGPGCASNVVHHMLACLGQCKAEIGHAPWCASNAVYQLLTCLGKAKINKACASHAGKQGLACLV